MTRCFLFCVMIGLLGFPMLVSADDGADSLFVNPDPDSKADTTQKVALDAYTGQSVRFFENLAADGYVVHGYRDDGSTMTSPVDSLTFGFGTDVRLDRTARAYASFYLSYPSTNTQTTNLYNPLKAPVLVTNSSQLAFSNINIRELFLDYALGNVAIIRIGRQSATWGEGRIFNPGNFLEDISDGMAVKTSFAAGPVALTAVAIKNDTEYGVGASDTTQALGLASVATAALAEYSLDWFSVGLSGFYHPLVGEKADAYFKTSLWSTDLFVEGVGERGTYGQQSGTGVAGLYREFGEQEKWLKLQAEWLLSGRGTTGTFAKVSNQNLGLSDNTFGIGATTELLSSVQTKPSVMWLHTLVDASGQVAFGLVNTTLPHLDLTLGVTHVYGDPGSRYILNNPDTTGRVWSLTIKASFHFDLNN